MKMSATGWRRTAAATAPPHLPRVSASPRRIIKDVYGVLEADVVFPPVDPRPHGSHSSRGVLSAILTSISVTTGQTSVSALDYLIFRPCLSIPFQSPFNAPLLSANKALTSKVQTSPMNAFALRISRGSLSL